ncbi:ras GTPase-activating-like protein IQGAP1 isoform X1 [Falco naumanni]|uniref:IQ motif containing GTPase activating protein 1 n=1 Tax=Falco tinnunculus TaxID=100819 RepID=A0A8C4UJQ3_FALTI|nr:ras GTPase-activating-like protein IQGAP1 isoform X1 [Falco naumanni]XP_040457956.1 ras GTPase-activating-like protein IQGAP1 isoform X1 [Falco naumanni]XP_040457957.1 ras GTPase-activating-like protein IQGAP1 isoform X1 [Falco naumanni]XP_055573034.1 ras GTPase-activating-like protein IQGAP1 [Falco cherrug]XP_055573035.1 ras GTPase-activating-like protein IQGAP1 [Falco cherrug]XP_055573036.1 ras GTPase-activating-like protein IQGAP1 [Falco cherrug]XP_055573037.1 ras GTPase-activating-like
MAAEEAVDGLAMSRPHYGSVLDNERLTAEEMDERRRQNVAYEYLCHLEEAKRWMEACLSEELPPTTELEEGLRNGVYLAKLGNFFSPKVVSVKKIYDREQTRYKATGLHFRHTDNVIQWLNAMAEIGLPKIFYPETTDIYDRKNMPRCIYCIHALSLYLFKLGLAPQIQDLYGKVDFTEEEISNMRLELEKYGIQMPAFSKIGGILANELSVDEAALHAAVIAINEAIDHQVPADTLMAMKNPNAMLINLDDQLESTYQDTLYRAKQDKMENAKNRIASENSERERDVYEELLTQAEIQGNINKVNTHAAISKIDLALEQGDALALYEAMATPALGLRGLLRENCDWYFKQFLSDRQQKQEAGLTGPLQKEELQLGVDAANRAAQQYQQRLAAVARINSAIRMGDAEKTVAELMNPEAQLPEVYVFAADLYQRELATLQQQSPEGNLTHPELSVAVEMLSSVALINRALDSGDVNTVWKQLSSPVTGLTNIEDENSQRYIDDLMKLKAQARAEGNEFITWNDIQSCVDRVNIAVHEEHERILAIGLINEALDEGDSKKTIQALQIPAAKLEGVAPKVAQHYQDTLLRAKREKAQDTQDETAVLWLDEIQDGIHRANKDTEESERFSLGILAINEAVDHGVVSQTLSALRSPDVGLYGVTPECAETYQRELSEVKRRKMAAGGNGSEWVKHWVRGGYHYYHNLRTKEGGWDEPAEFVQNDTQLSREEIQSTISGVTAAYNREQLWLANENLITKLQACCRGYLVRQEFNSRMNFLKKQVPAITCIQSQWRGYKQRKAYQIRLDYLRAQKDQVVKIQSMTRMYQARRRYRDRLQYFRNHINDVIKIQAFIRANKAREDYKTLINAENPPMAVVRKFVHLLDQSDQDFQEELELMKLREEVVTLIRSNQQLENDLNLMDIKIGLLVKNKITLQDVVSHSKKLTKKNKEQLSDMMMLNKQRGGLKALSKEKREKLEAYQHLFYLLQTNPTYLAKLIFQMPQNKSTKFMDSVIFTLYNYASNQREEYLLLRLFQTALQEEIKSKVDQIQEIVTGNPTVIKMVVSFNRGARGQNALRQILAPVVKEIIDDKSLNIKTDPVDIYKSWVNQMESQTGEASKLPYDVTPEQALNHEEVRTRLDASIRNMRTVTDKFLSAIVSSVDKIPYGMRFIAKVLKDSLHDKFPDAGEDELLKIVGNLLYYRYMNPAIVAPDAFDIIDLSAGGQLTTDQRRNLGSIAKMLQHAASNKMFMGDNAHLSIINEYLSQSYQKFRRFFQAACEVPELQDKFNIDEYSDLVTLTKPVIYISIGEIINTHTLLLDHQDAIAPEHNDPIHELLDDLGEVPTIESLIGEGSGNVNDPNREMLAKTEVSLTLTNKFDVPGDENAEMDARTILLNTKRLIVDVIRFQPGETLSEILETPATSEQEVEHQRAMQKRAIRDAKTPDKMKKSVSVKEDGNLNLQEKKDKIKIGLKKLTELGTVNAKNKYQELINDIAKDIRNQRRYRQRRKAELVKLQQTYSALNSKATFYGEQVDYYKSYIKTCLDNLASKGKVSKKPREMKGKNSKKISLKYTAARLHEKGVLLEIEDLQSNQFKNVIFEISPTEEVGDFEVKAKFMGVQMETFMLHYQDLLQLQYEGVAVMKLFDRAKVNVNLLIFLLNKKFYGK